MKINKSMKMSMSLAAALLTSGSINAATIVVGDALIPAGLDAGDTFHLVFGAKDDGTIGSQKDLNTISSFVNEVANNLSGNTGSVVASLNASWLVIGSGVLDQAVYDGGDTTLTNARDYAVVSTAVYLISGEQVATGFADIWDATIATEIDLQEDGTTAFSGVVYTSTLADGTVNGASRTIGVTITDDGRLARGIVGTGSGWVNNGDENNRFDRGFYALSEAITIQGSAAVPEPSTTALLGLGGLALILRRRK